MEPSIAIGIHNCASEPIHIPGQIQDFGFLISFDQQSERIDYASANAVEIFGQELLQKNISFLLSPELCQIIKLEIQKDSGERAAFLFADIKDSRYVFTFYRSSNQIVLEFEQDLSSDDPSFLSIYKNLNLTFGAMDRARDFQSLCDLTTVAVRKLIDFERVMIYRFDPDWNGTVLAESLGKDLEPYLGLQYPASDIPSQARALYERNWLRYTPNVHYKSQLIFSREEKRAEPLDQGKGRLRAVSPIHIQYLKNMGVGSSVSISIKKDGKLWGLIACLNSTSKNISFEVRQGMELIGKHFSLQIMTKEKSGDEAYRRELMTIIEELTLQMKDAPVFTRGLLGPKRSILELAKGASGGSILYRNQIQHFGNATDEMNPLVQWIASESKGPAFFTTSLERNYPEAKAFRKTAAGVLAISIPEGQPFWIILYKPEVLQTVNWGGNPNKPLETDASGTFLGPRRSFEIWKQKVEGTSLAWSSEEIEAMEDLRRTVIEVDLERQVQAALTSNDELENYARVISHDLKEPLRGIGNLAQFLFEDLKGKLNEESTKNLHDISVLTSKTKNLISELYEYSKIGKIDMAFEPVDLNLSVDEAITRLSPFLDEHKARVEIKGKLPVVRCDHVRIVEVFVNLFTNAVKYNKSAHKLVLVSAEKSNSGVKIIVKDNGIGIPQDKQEEVFRMFKRLHAEGEYGGGTGTGLAIVKKIIERHGGKIFIHSDPSGTAFNFTLTPDKK